MEEDPQEPDHAAKAQALWERMRPYVEEERAVEEAEINEWLQMLRLTLGAVSGSLKQNLLDGLLWAILHGQSDHVADELHMFALEHVCRNNDQDVWGALVQFIIDEFTNEDTFGDWHAMFAEDMLEMVGSDDLGYHLNPRLEHLGACCTLLCTRLRDSRLRRLPYGWQFKEWDFETDGQDVLISPRKLGQGTYGVVYLAFMADTESNLPYVGSPGNVPRVPIAVKILYRGDTDEVLDDCRRTDVCRSHAVVRLMRTPEQHKVHPRHLVMENVDSTLDRYIHDLHNDGAMNENTLRRLAKQLVQAVKRLHEIPMSHRGIKPANVGIVSNLACPEHCSCAHPCRPCPLSCEAAKRKGVCLKLMSLNEATDVQMSADVVGTPYYMAPELLMMYVSQSRKPYNTKKLDVWSVALVILFVALGERPVIECNNPTDLLAFLLHTTSHEVAQMQCEEPSPDKQWSSFPRRRWFSDDLVDLLNGMFRINPQHRLSMHDVCAHRWFTQHEDDVDDAQA